MVIVSYDLAIWEGDRSADDAAGDEEYRQLHARHIRSEPEPPTRRLRHTSVRCSIGIRKSTPMRENTARGRPGP